MGFEESFDIDVEKLSRFYKDLQKKLHPDKYSRKSEVIKPLSQENDMLDSKTCVSINNHLTL